MSLKLTFPALCLFTILFAASAFASPGVINYQGRLTDASGVAVTDPVEIIFTFWDSEEGGAQLGAFSDADTVTPDSSGVYSTMIGDDPGNPVPPELFRDNSVYLNVNVGGEDLAPRKRFSSGGYAFYADEAGSVSALGSIHAAAIKSGFVAEARISPAIARIDQTSPKLYDAVVAPSGGDFPTIQNALSAGAKSIFVRNGTYTMSSPIDVSQSGVSIIGESPGGVILDASGTDYNIDVHGFGNTFDEGTATFQSKTNIVRGDGTSWSGGVEVGEQILLGARLYEIADVEDDDVIRTTLVYQGDNLKRRQYKIGRYLENVRIENLTIVNSAQDVNGALGVSYVVNSRFKNCAVKYTQGPGAIFTNCVSCDIENIESQTNGGRGIVISNCQASVVREISSWNNKDNGMYLIGCEHNSILNNQCVANSSHGFALQFSSHNVFQGNNASFNNQSGIYMINSNDNDVKDNHAFHNAAIGLNINSSNGNVITGNSFIDANTHGVSLNNAEKNVITGNVIKENQNSGVYLEDSDSNSVTGNTITDNMDYGVDVSDADSRDNVIGLNILRDNDSGAGKDDGTNTQTTTNLPGF